MYVRVWVSPILQCSKQHKAAIPKEQFLESGHWLNTFSGFLTAESTRENVLWRSFQKPAGLAARRGD
jgi:hypothetical protein